MVKLRSPSLAIMLLVGSNPFLAAQELKIDQSKLYVSDPAACDALKDKGPAAFSDLDFLTLSFDRGIESLEFHCTFFEVKALPYNSHLFVSAVCEAPGEVYPDTMSISAYDEQTIQLVSSHDAMMVATGSFEPPGPTTNPGVTMYHRCENLSEIPVD